MAIKVSNQITFTEQKKIVEIQEWYLATSQGTGVTTTTSGWTQAIQTINKDNKYLWNYEKVIYSLGDPDVSEPIVIGFYGKGADGKSISNIVNYYATTTVAENPPSSWKSNVPTLTPENKYLWNYEEIIYTDGSKTTTDAAIIGAYGDSGADAVDFQIYSVNGFEFNDSLTSIELKTVAFQSGKKLPENSATYQWQWWNTENSSYVNISNATSFKFTVNSSDIYSHSSIKCVMTYDGIAYEDYVSLTTLTDVYTATVKFFDGNNVIATNKTYLIAYVELYKNNQAEELMPTKKIHVSDSNAVSNGTITPSGLTGSYNTGDMMYFVYKNSGRYDVVLGRYDASSTKWTVQTHEYQYKNDVWEDSISPVIFIPKGKISKSLLINCEVRKNNSDANVVARTSAVVMDLNDPIVGNAAPSNPVNGQLWLDTSVSPSLLKMFDGTKWVDSGYQNGNVVYTSIPQNGYTLGDLWILADGETCGNFGPGSLLKTNTTSSTFNSAHWQDAMSDNTELLNNVKQYFLFNANTGLRIGQLGDQFYVNIDATEMGFYDASAGSDKKVVSIGNKSATIRDLTIEEGAQFNCEVKFGSFVWKIESNGSLSLAIAT